MAKTMKPMMTKQPRQPRIVEMKRAHMVECRENFAGISQLIAVAINHCDMSAVPNLKEEMSKSIEFLDNMRFIFNRIADSDAVKIEK